MLHAAMFISLPLPRQRALLRFRHIATLPLRDVDALAAIDAIYALKFSRQGFQDAWRVLARVASRRSRCASAVAFSLLQGC